MRIWLISQCNPNKPGGVATHISLLDRGLKTLGHEVEVIASGSMPGFANRALISVPMRVINKVQHGKGVLYAAKVHGLKMGSKTRWRILRDGAPSFFGCQDVLSVDRIIRLRDNPHMNSQHVPIVLTVHSRYTYEKVGQGWIKAGSDAEHNLLEMERNACLRADAVVAVSDQIRMYIEELIAPEHRDIHVLRNATDTDVFMPNYDEQSRAQIRAKYGISQTAFVVLCSGHLQEIKGVDYAAKAALLMCQQHPEADWQLVFAGDGKLHPWLETFIQEHKMGDHIKLLGSQSYSNMPDLYGASDALVMPSVPTYRAEESLGISALEASACCLPVIGSTSGGIKEVVTDGKTGILVPPKEVEPIAHAIWRLYSDRSECQRLGIQGREFVTTYHDYNAHAEKYAAIGFLQAECPKLASELFRDEAAG
jgi:glycogen(starch) synthase